MPLTPARLCWSERLGMAEPQTEAEAEAIVKQAIEVILKNGNKSGYAGVVPSASSINPWQAKPYIQEKKRYANLGSFETPEAAAKKIIQWMYGAVPTPPTPSKDRNKRHEGRRKRDRRNHGQGALPWPNPHTKPLSRCFPFMAGGVDLRTSDHRPKKAKEALPAGEHQSSASHRVSSSQLSARL